MLKNLFKFNKKSKLDWNNIEYPFSEQTINDKLISNIINKFWKDNIIDKSEKDNYLLFMFRVRLLNDDIKTLTKLQKIKFSNKELLKSYLSLKSFILKDIYSDLPIKSIIISWGIREFKNLKFDFIDSLEDKPTETTFHYFNKIKLPISCNILDYGKIIDSIDNIMYNIKIDNKTSLNIRLLEKDGFKFHLISFIKNNNKIVSFEDKIISGNKLIRTIGQSVIEYENGEITMVKTVKKSTMITKIKPDKKFDDKIIAADLETVLSEDNKMTPYLASHYEKKRNNFIFNKNSNNLFATFFNRLFIRSYRNHKIYFHNLSGFDGYFLMRYLINLGYNIYPLMHNGKLISIDIFSKTGKYNFYIRDSNLLLLQSLKKLAINFNIDTKKGIFPYYLKDINYKGNYPDYKYFNNFKVNLNEYLENKNKFTAENKIWIFKDESIKYCINDSFVLYQIINIFAQFIYKNFNLNITKYPTIPSLAFAIYRCHYLPENTIPVIKGNIKKDIQLGYTGGSTDMFIPKNPYGTKIYAYDVNSLYPFVMQNNDFPVGNPTYFEKPSKRNLKDNLGLFGHFFAKINTTKDLKHPILQLHHNNRTVSPLGSFEGWFFSEELKNSLKFGYEIEIIKGYLFERKNIFKAYIEFLYNLRLQFPNPHSYNWITKLLMNSLYGRFGMSENFSDIIIIEFKELNNYLENYKGDIEDIIEFDNHYILKLKSQRSIESDLNDVNDFSNVNIAIASAVTAYGRIHMSQFKNNTNLPNLYYSDTDSVYFDGPLPDNFISSKELGKMKLEGIFDEAIFLAPKVYALKNNDCSEPIIKIKGLTKEAIQKNKISIDSLSTLLNKDYKNQYTQDKWFRNISEANIQILEQIYTLKATDNKRELIFKNNKLINTTPFILNKS